MTKLKVLIDATVLTDQFRFRGIGNLAYSLIRKLLRDNSIEWQIMAPGSKQEMLEALELSSPFAPSYDFEFISLGKPAGLIGRIITPVHYYANIAPKIRKAKPDIFFSLNVEKGIPQNIPTVALMHDVIPYKTGIYSMHSAFANRLKKYNFQWSLERAKSADKVLTISEFTKSDLVSIGFPEEKITVAPLAISDFYTNAVKELGEKISDESVKRRTLNIYNLTEPYILYVGGLENNKNVDQILLSFAKLTKRFPDLKLAIGGGEFKLGWDHKAVPLNERAQKIFDLAQELKIFHKVIFTGFIAQNHLPLIHKYARAFVHLSKYEGFGLAVLEPQLVGTPVIAADKSSYPEVLKDSAILVNPDETDEIAESIAKVVIGIEKDDDEVQKLREKGKQNAARFSWNKTATITIQALKNLHAEVNQRKTHSMEANKDALKIKEEKKTAEVDDAVEGMEPEEVEKSVRVEEAVKGMESKEGGKVAQGKIIQSKIIQDKAEQDKVEQDKEEQDEVEQVKIKQDNVEQDKVEQEAESLQKNGGAGELEKTGQEHGTPGSTGDGEAGEIAKTNQEDVKQETEGPEETQKNDDKQKAVVLAPYFFPLVGGMEQVAIDYAKFLAKMGYETIVITSDRKGEKELHPKEEVLSFKDEGQEIKIRVLRLKRYGKNYYFYLLKDLYKLLKQINPSIIHSHGFGFIGHDIALWRYKKFINKKVKIINTPHGPFMSKQEEGLRKLFKKLFTFMQSLYISTIYDNVFAVNQEQHKWMQKDYGVDPEKVTLMPPIMPGVKGGTQGAKNILKFKEQKKHLTISSISRLADYKGFEDIIAAFNEANTTIDTKLIIAGKDDNFADEIQKLVNNSPRRDDIIFEKDISDARRDEILKETDIFVFASEWEAFGIVIAEAMAYGAAIISSSTEGGRFLVEVDRNGYIFEYKDLKGLINQLNNLITDQKLLRKFQQESIKMVKRFSKPILYQKFTEFIRSYKTKND